MATDKNEQLTPNFKRSEFACKCGCGFDSIDLRLVNMCQTIRDRIGKPIKINSACRCAKHNAKCGGVKNSTHTLGYAADLSCSVGAKVLFQTIKDLYNEGKLPDLSYCLMYPTFCHIDCGKPRNNRFAVK